jgi:hypothetical protein
LYEGAVSADNRKTRRLVFYIDADRYVCMERGSQNEGPEIVRQKYLV